MFFVAARMGHSLGIWCTVGTCERNKGAKTITNSSFADKVTIAGDRAIYIIFMILLPLATLAIGIIVFIRRKNAE